MTIENREPKTENRLFRIFTFGCKVNQCDSAGLARELTQRGWRPAAAGTVPDLLLVNTCTVTARADQQARQLVRRLAREHPGAPLWVTGCYAQRAPAEVAALPGVQAVFGNQEKAGLAQILNNWENQGLEADFSFPLKGEGRGGGEAPCSSSPSLLMGEDWGGGENLPAPPHAPPEPRPGLWVEDFSASPPFQPWRVHAVPGHTRAWLKIQEGCSHHCRYCIVPKVRGPRRSLEPAAVVAAFQDLAALGYQEVVLTGVDLAQYGLDHAPVYSLAALVRHLRAHPWPFRVRLSSLEPMMVTAALLDELAAWQGFCPHFHLPLQSGAAPVLAAMGRPYGPDEFRDLVDEISRRFPGAALGLDVLVGFPGESEADFAATRDLVAALPVTYLHVFPFSPRPGTPAALLPALPGRVVQERARLMRELGQKKKQKFLEAQLGQVREVLVEGPAPQTGWLQGLSDHYLRVIFPGPPAWRNRRVKVRLRVIKEELLLGEPVAEP
ncbi:MAG: tRNA (N(6)-L-threonylcarbamoyladenosine(37)-C(2))-methylthiotransferase MtaB [Syntrophobacterales bacterium]|jgi:threonylcarbamoyladenosine tRNA methylthiotransferase MtaB|nr:tRNA (N(6)-L-threonylcarbamoyladenosine(37)-C(2))-methylthiotransferase MtaB [Syntrophobacterales bacterium]